MVKMEVKKNVDKLIGLTRIRKDKKYADRIYVPNEMIKILSLKNKGDLLLNKKDSMHEMKLAGGGVI